jgi:hypothetical protein
MKGNYYKLAQRKTDGIRELMTPGKGALCEFITFRCRTTPLFLSHNPETDTELIQEFTMEYAGLHHPGREKCPVILLTKQRRALPLRSRPLKAKNAAPTPTPLCF